MTVQASRRTVTAALPLAIVAAFVIVPVVAVVTAGMGAEAHSSLTAASSSTSTTGEVEPIASMSHW